MTKAERLKLLEKANKVRQEKLLRKLYEENKYDINLEHYVGYQAFKNQVLTNLETNPNYKDLKEHYSLVSAGRKLLRTKHYMEQDRIGELYVREALKATKTGRYIKWGKKEEFIEGKGYVYTPKTREETMYDVLRSKLGFGKKLELFYDRESKSYHFIGKGGLEYEIAIDKYKNIKEILLYEREY